MALISQGGGGSTTITVGTTVFASGTEGSVLFVGASSVVQQDNAKFFWDDTNDRLGIGTATPAATLDVTVAAVAGGIDGILLTPGDHTAVTAEKFAFRVTAQTITITGAVVTQRFNLINQPTVSAASSLTVTTGVTLSVGAPPTVASSAVITNSYGLQLSQGGTTANAAGSNWSALQVAAGTVTLSTTTQMTQSPSLTAARFGILTANQSGGAVTVDNAATVYIAGALTAGASVTITNNYALWVDAGVSRFDGNITVADEVTITNTSGYGIKWSASSSGNLQLQGAPAFFEIALTKIYANGNTLQLETASQFSEITSYKTSVLGRALAGGSNTLVVTPAAHTALTAESSDIVLTAHGVTLTDGTTIATQRSVVLNATTYNGVAAGGTETVSAAFTLDVAIPAQGTNLTLSAASGIRTAGIVTQTAALATDATRGFLYIPTCAGAPTGTPEAFTGTVAMVFDTTNNKLMIYDGSWLGGTTPGAFV